MKKTFFASAVIWTLSLTAVPAAAVNLVSQATIDEQKAFTKTFKLKNGIPVIYREVPKSDIIQINVAFNFGLSDLPPGQKVLSRWVWEVVPRAGGKYKRSDVVASVEKYAFEIGCRGGIEHSSCSLGTINDYWEQGLPLLSALIKSPSFEAADVKLEKDRLIAELKGATEDPDGYINEIVNRVFYPVDHPYRNLSKEALAEISKFTVADLKRTHQEALNAKRMQITVVGSIPLKTLTSQLEKQFGAIPGRDFKSPKISNPPYSAPYTEFEAREIPTAYILAKFTAPPITSEDAVGSMLMFEILDQLLSEEIRTKKSLSYAVYSSALRYSIGVGLVGASTPKPKETLEAMVDVMERLKAKPLSTETLEEYKNVFATSYFQTLETHGSLAGMLASYFHYFGTVDPFYELPNKLASVTPADVHRLANQSLKNMRLGVLYDKAKFEESWGKKFIKNLESSH